MEDDIEICNIFTKLDGSLFYKILPLDKQIYNTNFRLKPFITSYARHKMFKVIYENNLFNHVLRIHTDSVVLDRSYDFSNQYNGELIPEDKTTGKIEFININNYNKLT